MWIIWPFRKKNFGSAWTVYADFGRFIEAKTGEFVIRDEKSLPHSKRDIFDAICILLITETQSSRLEAIRECAFELAFFQKDVGDDPLHPLGIDMNTVEIGSLDPGHLARYVMANPTGKEKYDRFKLLRDSEWERMKVTMTKLQRKSAPVQKSLP